MIGDSTPSSAPAKRAKKPKVKLPRTLERIPCVLLAIDPGSTNSGWSILDLGVGDAGFARGHELYAAGDVREGVYAVVLRAVERARELELPLVVVGERWSGKWKAIAQVQGLGAAWKAWERALAWAKVPKARVVRVLTQSWRAVVLGGKSSSEEWKKRAVAFVNLHFAGTQLSHDAAEAVCMGVWASRAGEVLEAMPKPKAPKKAREVKTYSGTKLSRPRKPRSALLFEERDT